MEQLNPCTTTTEAHAPRVHAPQQEKPPQREACALQLESSHCLPQLEKAHVKEWRLSAAKKKKELFHPKIQILGYLLPKLVIQFRECAFI